VFAASSAYGQTDATLATEVARCSAIESESARLSCFDAIASEVESAAPTISDLGAERLRDTDEESELQSFLVGDFTGWSGDTIFRLENGQTWQQIDSSYQYGRAERPLMTIKQAAFVSYLLQVEGYGQTVRVRRIK
jgi:hypothetical protein